MDTIGQFSHRRDLAVVFSLYFITDEIWQCQISSEISDDIGQLYSNITDRSHGASYMAISDITGYFDMTYFILHKNFLLLSLTRKISNNIVQNFYCFR